MALYNYSVIGTELNAESDFNAALKEFCVEAIEQITDTPNDLLRFKSAPELCTLLIEAVRRGYRNSYVCVAVQDSKLITAIAPETGVTEEYEDFYETLRVEHQMFDEVKVELSFI